MKPVSLSMTAFGSYKDREVIDFEQLEGHHLFVISGPTGAGKTTIFDAICFALYGSASGSDRENPAMLRSHFADDDVHTAVEFIFELNGRKYRVLRQLGHVKKGNKTKTGERYELYEILADGSEVPCVDRQTVTEINKKIEEIIGLTEEQFKQIVMLPQGEFRKLLTSETENKEEILRRIFKTERYQKMNTILKDKKDGLQEQLHREEQLLDHHIQSLSTVITKREHSPLFEVLDQEYFNVDQVLAGLEEEITFLEQQTIKHEKNYQQTVKQFEEKQQYFFQMKAINEKFAELDEKKVQLVNLQKEKDVITNKELQVQLAERARSLEPYEKQLMERREELKGKKQAFELAKLDLETAKNNFTNAEKVYLEEEKNEEKREQIKRQLERFNEFLPIVENLTEQKEKMKILQHKISEKTNEQTIISRKIVENKKQIEQLKEELGIKEKQILQQGEKEAYIIQLQNKYKVLNQYLDIQKKEYEIGKQLKEVEKEFRQAEKNYKEYESIWLENQALILASNLQAGEPCPVCGSTHHPHKKMEAEGVSREEFERRREEFDIKEKAYREVYNEYSAVMNQLKSQAKEVASFDVSLEHVKEELNSVIDEGKKVREEINKLKEISEQVNQMRSKVVKLETEMKEAQQSKEEVDKEFQKLQTEYTSLKTTVMERTRNIPEEIQDLKVLEQNIKETETKRAHLENRWKNAQKQYEAVKEQLTTAQVNFLNLEKQVNEIAAIVNNLEKSFLEKLNEVNFASEQQYISAQLSDAYLEQLQKEIEEYNQEVTNVEKRIEDLTNELRDKKRIDLAQLEEELDKLKSVRDQAFEQWNSFQKQLEAANSLQQNIVNVRQSLVKIEKKLAVVNDLFDVLRGQNAKKISFERYLQIDYLDQIMHAANERFKSLTNEQYYLIRSDRQEAYGKQSGLAIDVYDQITGQTRDVKTLSGGEKFIASLCLALGMSDVIQSFQGSISIDTMFIDEGFGSLDEESLHKSIDALVSLQQTGRMIGVISHVEELKSMFPAMLEIKKTKEGYSKAKFVIK